jgi:hypothetical protein
MAHVSDFEGCEGRWDLLPKRIKGWLWSANQVRIDDTDKKPADWSYQPWSKSGHKKKPQPDNAGDNLKTHVGMKVSLQRNNFSLTEYYVAQVSESCLGILNNQYNDSVGWHDIGNCSTCDLIKLNLSQMSLAACYHKARFICEDSPILLEEVKTLTTTEKEETTTTTTRATTTTTTKQVTTTKAAAAPPSTAAAAESSKEEPESTTAKKLIRRRKLVKRVKI